MQWRRTKPVDNVRMSQVADFRAQVNVDQEVVAFAYNPMVEYLNREAMEVIRNDVASAVERVYARHFQVLYASHPEFRQLLEDYVEHRVSEDLRSRCRRCWQRLLERVVR